MSAVLDYRTRLRGLYHAVLTEIARQCPLLPPDSDEPFSERVAKAAWKEHCRGLFHPGRSSEELSDPEFYALILQVEAHFATEHGVSFPNRAERSTSP